ncbi:transforming growth factor beta activator LRRC33 [Scleropages formosus]|uniref:Negative regulator of reactive oxygen species n=1 Tax=Scleropages formosus TaxID=113540 RepID=A0A8C9RPI0_SCLFO|nr:transforming growth factor beta activator LRRC33-like [Scleropages formosus]XP_018596596.1 transforming growth factor beta activator LRRC33-like [Scleropages formosus]XP_029102164.1 transforming growth factor beta activator LRRC33-like [Scleropages formosus]
MLIISNFISCLLCLSLGPALNRKAMASMPCRLIQKTALCNSCRLLSVPTDLPENIEDLQLNDNSVEILRNYSLARYPSLHSLSCTNSHLDSIEINFFYNAQHLESLNLAENNLHAAFHQSGWALRTLVRLRKLDLSGNGLTEDMASFLLQNMTSLEYLSLSKNSLLRLDETTFHDLHQLRELDLERNMLFEIDGAFDGLHKLQRLNMAFNNLLCLIKFQLTELVVLNVSHNAVEWFVSSQDMEDTFHLEILDLSDNSLLFFPFLPIRSRIRNLLLSNNRISFYEHLANHTSPNWTTTVLFSNLNSKESLVSARLWDETSLHGDLSTIELLDMSGNQVSYLPRGFLSKLESLIRLRLRRNCLEYLDLAAEELPATLSELDVSNNRLSLLKASETSMNKLSSLTHLNLSFNDLQRLPSKFFASLPALTMVDLSYNRVGICSLEVEDTAAEYSDCVGWRNTFSLKQLHLAGCSLCFLPPSAFEGSPLTHLELSDNPGLLIGEDALTSLSRTLQHLGLGNTGVSNFDFTPFHYLRSLNFSGNSLVELPVSLLTLDLRWLDLSNNKLTTIPLGQANVLTQRLQTLFLGGNPFNCCTLDWYRLFQETKAVNIEDLMEVTCLLFNQARRRVDLRQWAMCGENSEEPSWWYIVLFLLVSLSLLGIIIIFIATFHPRTLPKVIKKTWQRPAPY